ncbi:hypothetical protein AB1Y20_010394 [Prymnesium parvum]|uniref:Uncharacterized protein n=1 Tax=Prymnesium parvum TaxID=97485 RepID=A0AB34IS34_PRYPA
MARPSRRRAAPPPAPRPPRPDSAPRKRPYASLHTAAARKRRLRALPTPCGAEVRAGSLVLLQHCLFAGYAARVLRHDARAGYECELAHCARVKVWALEEDLLPLGGEAAAALAAQREPPRCAGGGEEGGRRRSPRLLSMGSGA